MSAPKRARDDAPEILRSGARAAARRYYSVAVKVV
jgi:hypothetical protein